jgi:hypothetical protein
MTTGTSGEYASQWRSPQKHTTELILLILTRFSVIKFNVLNGRPVTPVSLGKSFSFRNSLLLPSSG